MAFDPFYRHKNVLAIPLAYKNVLWKNVILTFLWNWPTSEAIQKQHERRQPPRKWNENKLNQKFQSCLEMKLLLKNVIILVNQTISKIVQNFTSLQNKIKTIKISKIRVDTFWNALILKIRFIPAKKFELFAQQIQCQIFRSSLKCNF